MPDVKDNIDIPLQQPAVRWDRSLSEHMKTAEGKPVTLRTKHTNSILKVGSSIKRRFERALIKLLKGPALRVRGFLNAPIAEQIDQRRIYFENVIGELNKSVENLRSEISLLHAKADEHTRKTWPVIHLIDAYAVPLSDGYIFIPDTDEDILLMYARATSEGLEVGTRRVLKTILRPGDRAVDVGASVGLHTIAMACAVGSLGCVDVFEAEPRLKKVISRTLAVNGLHHVTLHSCAVGSEDGNASFNVARTIGHSSLYDLGPENLVRERITVPLMRLDSVIAPNSNVNLIKIDVEGAELDVIRGAKRLLTESTDCALIVECGPSHLKRINIPLEAWIDEFVSLGFEGYAINEASGYVSAMNLEWLAAQESSNIVFVKKNKATSRRLLSELGKDQ
jgi:FkbM family methyltransferase